MRIKRVIPFNLDEHAEKVSIVASCADPEMLVVPYKKVKEMYENYMRIYTDHLALKAQYNQLLLEQNGQNPSTKMFNRKTK